jgi:hypothetical protein
MGHFGEGIHSFVFHFHDSHIRLNGTKGEIFCRCGIRFGECIEEGGFSDVRQSDDSDFHRGEDDRRLKR